MTTSHLLHRLCELIGILPDYHDIWGTRHETTDESRRALLRGMGVACESDADIETSIAHWQYQIWHRRVPPVKVTPVALPVPITLYLPERVAQHAFGWQINYENGAQQNGTFHPHTLHSSETAWIDEENWRSYVLELPAQSALGYHRLTITVDGEAAELPLIVHPAQCFQPAAVQTERAWGIAVQLYGVRSSRNWGIGDFTDLRHLIDWAAHAGAGIVGVNPLHALYPHNPQHCSPYSPSSRQFVNVMFLDVEAVPEYIECMEARTTVAAPAFQARLRALRAAPLVEYAQVAETKFGILEMLYRHFQQHHRAHHTERAQAFDAYLHRRGEDLARFACYHALQEHLYRQDMNHWGWPVWPEAYRDPHSQAVAKFRQDHAERIGFFQYLQWLAEEQLGSIGWHSLELGLGIGLYQDLAVGVDRGGAETWGHQDLYALATRVGCPPDEFNPLGQDWGLPPWLPHKLRDAAYGPYIAMLRANMRNAGALRLDHVMGLMRLYWIPSELTGDKGAYVAYPFADLLGILALESQRNQCLIVGEDLGTVPDQVRTALFDMGVLSYRIFYFERSPDGSFLPPADFPPQALVAASTHDLPTLTGFWRGIDLDVRTALNLFPSEDKRTSQIVGRAEDRARVLVALEREGLLPEGLSVHPVNVPEMTSQLIQAIHRYLARTPSKITLLQAEDMLGELEQANLPGTVNEHPNWRRKLSLNLEEWANEARIKSLAEAMVAERGRAVHPHEPVPFPLRPVLAPRATYRLQFNSDFTFQQASELIPYLAQLGISHCYCSPYFKARPGSRHGYDITDHAQINPEVGSDAELDAFCARLAEHQMGQILDVVPNHMGIMGADNIWWLDVLENGEASRYADYFDIDWKPLKRALRGKVLIPVLGDHYGSVLERGELQLRHDADKGEFSIWYYEHRFPVDPHEYPRILTLRIADLGARMGEHDATFMAYQSLATAFSHLPARDDTTADKMAERLRDQAVLKRQWADMFAHSPDIQHFLAENLALINGQITDPTSFNLLHELISEQAYRLSYWRVAADEINYRRFFDINDLAALRIECAPVFEATHRRVFQMLQRNQLQGLRIDHADGLFAPAAYFEQLQHLHSEARPTAREGLYVIVEKILAPHERLREDWAVAGTTGYDFTNQLNGLFIDGSAGESMQKCFQGFVRERADFADVLYQSKRVIMKTALAAELNMLANRLARIAELDRYTRDYTLNSLRTALMEIVAAFPVYRTYIHGELISEDDRRHIEWACSVAKKRAQIADASIYDFVRDILLGTAAEGKNEAYRNIVTDFAMRFQQFSSPVMAKGMEDTAFYRFHPLASLNEVGGDPDRFGTTPNAFHRVNQERAQRNPHTLLATSTHDTKRSEDVRARLNVLSELPALWQKQLSVWHRLNRARRGLVEGIAVPSRRNEYLLYQTLLGIWPEGEPATEQLQALRPRLSAYLIKAVREAKEKTSWVNPNPEYETQLQEFVAALLDPESGKRFHQAFSTFAAPLIHFGRLNSLAQTLLKLTVPGVPDLYQGMELWDDSLVDPDNRRPVDYAKRRTVLDELIRLEAASGLASLPINLLETYQDGRIKAFIIWKLLQLRQQEIDLFSQGDYLPLTVDGPHAPHVFAFMRIHKGSAILVAVPRLAYTLLQGKIAWPVGESVWQDTRIALPPVSFTWIDVLTGQRLSTQTADKSASLHLAALMPRFPLAVLRAESTLSPHSLNKTGDGARKDM